MIIYEMVNIFSMKNYKSSRKLGVGLNWYPGMNWSTTTTASRHKLVAVISWPSSPNLEIATNLIDVVTSALLYLRVEPWHDPT